MDKVTQPGQGQVGAPMQGQQGQRPGQQQPISADELFKTIGELTVQLRVANQMIGQLQQEKAKRDEDLKKPKEDTNG